MTAIKFKLGNWAIVLISTVIVALFLFWVFGTQGVQLLIPVFILGVPLYLIFNNFKFDFSEKIVFSLYASIGIFPSFVYFLGLWIGNLIVAVGITFFLLSGIGMVLSKFRKGTIV